MIKGKHYTGTVYKLLYNDHSELGYIGTLKDIIDYFGRERIIINCLPNMWVFGYSFYKNSSLIILVKSSWTEKELLDWLSYEIQETLKTM